jgi:hypothetical protein
VGSTRAREAFASLQAVPDERISAWPINGSCHSQLREVKYKQNKLDTYLALPCLAWPGLALPCLTLPTDSKKSKEIWVFTFPYPPRGATPTATTPLKRVPKFKNPLGTSKVGGALASTYTSTMVKTENLTSN